MAPSVTVLVLNPNGPEHLEACLSSLKDQTYADGRVEVRVISDDTSRGGGQSRDAAIRASESDFVALLDADTRVDRTWLTELLSAADRHQAGAVGSTILDWTGEAIDFAGSHVSFAGHPVPIGGQRPPVSVPGDRPLLFPSTASALFNRATLLDAGGFDETFLGTFDDVDLGWRLNLLGHPVMLARNAITYRRARRVPSPAAVARRTRLEECNALAMIYKNYDADALARVLPAAIALSLWRGLTAAGINTLQLEMSSRPSKVFDTGHRAVAHLIALEDFCQQLASLKIKRRVIQGRRMRTDADLFRLFGEPFPLQDACGPTDEIARVLIDDLGIDEILCPSEGSQPPRRAVPRTDAPTLVGSRPAAGLPTVSIVILTAIGPTHLRQCLTSLMEQTYPADRIEVIIVDNGSADDPTDEARRSYPEARVILNPTNLGFAAGNNLGASVAKGDYIVFLNDDTRTDPRWLHELVDTASRTGAAAVASCVLDWSGTRIDFVEGAVNFQGKGFQLHYDAPAGSLALKEHPLLFACGAAMLVDRAVLIDAGLWDERAFAYYEDVELGWRLHLLGHRVWFSPGAVVYHKHHGTSGQWAEPPRVRLYERNSLRMLYGLLETESLERALSAALLLAADRALLGTQLSRVHERGAQSPWRRVAGVSKELLRARGINRTTTVRQGLARLGVRGLINLARDVVAALPLDSSRRRGSYRIERGDEAFPTTTEPLPIDAAAKLAGIYGFLSDLPDLSRRRAEMQRRRQATDAQILGPFGGQWLSPSSAAPFQAEHDALHTTLIKEFALATIIEDPPSTTGRSATDHSSGV